MKPERFPKEIQPYLVPEPRGKMMYRCLECKQEFDIERLLYTCPGCGGVLLLHDKKIQDIKKIEGKIWRDIFDYRKMLNYKALKGIFRYYEFIAPIIPLDRIVYLGRGTYPPSQRKYPSQRQGGSGFLF